MKKIYKVIRGGYDYFDYDGKRCAPETIYEGTSLREAWDAYKTSQKFDYHYDDSWMETQAPIMKWVADTPKQKKHGVVVGHKPTTRIQYLQAAARIQAVVYTELREELLKHQKIHFWRCEAHRDALNKEYDKLFAIYDEIELLRNPPHNHFDDVDECDDYDQYKFDPMDFDFGQ